MKFRKKPVVIEAVQFNKNEDIGNAALLWGENFQNALVFDMETDEVVGIDTLEGMHRLSKGDWIIKGVKGEFYPCKPDIFEMTYEKS